MCYHIYLFMYSFFLFIYLKEREYNFVSAWACLRSVLWGIPYNYYESIFFVLRVVCLAALHATFYPQSLKGNL